MNACAAIVHAGQRAQALQQIARCAAGIAVRRAMPARRKSRIGDQQMPSWRNPASSVIRLRRLRTNSSAPTTSTSDSATCATTSARRRPKRSRRVGRAAAAGFHRGAGRGCRSRGSPAPGRRAGRSTAASAAVNAKTRQSSGERRRRRGCSSVRRGTRPGTATEPLREQQRPAPAPADGDQQALGEQLTDDAAARRADAPGARRSRARARSRAPASGSRGWRRRSAAPARSSPAAATAASRTRAAASTRRCRAGIAPSLKSR